MRRLASTLLALLVTAVCFWLLLTPDVVRSLGRVVAGASPLPILAALLLGVAVQWLRAWRFAMLMSGRTALPDAGLVRIAFQLNFLNFALPFRLGELGFPVLMRRRYGTPLLHAGGVLLLARLFDLLSVGSILLAAAAVLRLGGETARLLLAAGALVLALAPFALPPLARALQPSLTALPRARGAVEALGAGAEAMRDPAVRTAAIAVGMGLWLVLALMAVLAAGAVVATVPPAAAVLGGAAGNVAFALPVNGIAGLGPAQAAWVAATVQAGVPWNDAVASALAVHAVVLANALMLGGIAMLAWPGDDAPRG